MTARGPPNRPRIARMLKLTDHLGAGAVVDLVATTRMGAIEELIEAAGAGAPVTDRERFFKAVVAREKALTTGVGDGIAIPHARVPEVKRPFAVLGRSRRGIDYGAADGRPVQIAVLIGTPERQAGPYLQILSRALSLLVEPEIRKKLMAAGGADDIRRILVEAES